MGRPAKELIVSTEERKQLEAIARSQSLPAALRRAQMILLMSEGEAGSAVAQRFGLSRHTVTLWRTRFRERGLAGLYNELKPGRPHSMSDEPIAALINRTLKRKLAGRTHWSRRLLAAAMGLSTTTVHRYRTLLGLQPHRSCGFKLSTDAFFIEKVRDIVALYLNPPDHALVLCVDEKSQVQAYVRHGTTTLFAAIDIANGSVITQCKPKHRYRSSSRFCVTSRRRFRQSWTCT